MTLKAPFPWFGGKSRAAHLVWPRFGDVANYVEPFAGSLAVLLARPHEPKVETVNDTDRYLVNFWRAVRHDPEAVAHYADWPVNEVDLRARHDWLVTFGRARLARLDDDPDDYDPRIAGWWVWGLCWATGRDCCCEPPRTPRLGQRGARHRPRHPRDRAVPHVRRGRPALVDRRGRAGRPLAVCMPRSRRTTGSARRGRVGAARSGGWRQGLARAGHASGPNRTSCASTSTEVDRLDGRHGRSGGRIGRREREAVTVAEGLYVDVHVVSPS